MQIKSLSNKKANWLIIVFLFSSSFFTSSTVFAQTAKSFVYPVQGVSNNDITKNFVDPRLDGWFVNNYYGNYCQSCDPGYPGKHPGVDYNLDCDTSKIGNQQGNCDLDQPVYAIAEGTVIKSWKLSDNLLYGVIIEHKLPKKINIKDYLFPGTTSTTKEVDTIYSGYLHLKTKDVKENDVVKLGDKLGTIGNPGGTGAHLHLEIHFKKRTTFPRYQATSQNLTDKSLLSPFLFLASQMPPCKISSTGSSYFSVTSGCWERGGQHWWETASTEEKEFYTYTTNEVNPDSYGKWHLEFEKDGTYDIEVFVPELSSLSQKAKYKLWLNKQVTYKVIDQKQFAGKFASLGTYTVKAGKGHAIRLDDNTGEPYSSNNKTKLAFGALKVTPRIEVGSCAAPPCETNGTHDAGAKIPPQKSGCSYSDPSAQNAPILFLIFFGMLVLFLAVRRTH